MTHIVYCRCNHAVTLLGFSGDERFMDAFIEGLMRGLCPACVAFQVALASADVAGKPVSRDAAMRILHDFERRFVQAAAREAHAKTANGGKP